MLCQDVKEFFQISAEHHLQQYLDLTCNEKHYSIIYANISDIKVQHIQKYSDCLWVTVSLHINNLHLSCGFVNDFKRKYKII